MLFLYETHAVVGSREDAFEALLRDQWLPALARSSGARLLYFLKHAHGTGISYRVVTITALADAQAWQELMESVDSGALRLLAEQLDTLRHDVEAKMLIPLPWYPLQALPLEEVPTSAASHETTVFMEDTVWPEEGCLERYVEAAGAHYAREMAERGRARQAILSVDAAFRTAFGSGRRREVVLWQKLLRPEALDPLVRREVPERYRKPGMWMHDALALRDQWESRLLRAVAWSPLY